MIPTIIRIKDFVYPDKSEMYVMECDTCGWSADSTDKKETLEISKHHLIYSHGVGVIRRGNADVFVSPRPK